MNSLLSVHVALLLILAIHSFGQNTFIKYFTPALSGEYPYARDLYATPDTGFTCFGSSEMGSSSGLFLKTDKFGNAQFVKVVSGPGAGETYQSGVRLSTGSYMAAGETYTLNVLGEVFISSFNNQGTLQWSRSLSAGNTSSGYYGPAIIRQLNSNAMVTSFSSYDTLGNASMVLTRHDLAGNLIWSKQYRDTVFLSLPTTTGMTVRDANSIFIAGICTIQTQDIVGAQVDSTGALAWNNVYSANPHYLEVCFTDKTLDGGYIMGGKFIDAFTMQSEFMLIKINGLGVLQWGKRYNNNLLTPVKGSCVKVIQAPDSSYYASIGLNDGFGDALPAMMKVDKNGNFLWGKCFQIGYLDGYAYSRPVLAADGLPAVVYTTYDQNWMLRVALIKTDINGGSICLDSSFILSTANVFLANTAVLSSAEMGSQGIPPFTGQEIVYPQQLICSGNVGLSEMIEEVQMEVYPNPATSEQEVYLEFNETLRKAEIVISDLSGRAIRTYHDINGTSFSFSPSGIPSGLYLVSVNIKGIVQTSLLSISNLE